MCYQQVNDMCEVSPTEWWVAFSPHSWHLCDQRECYHTSHLSSWITGSNFNTSWLTSLWSQSPITPHTFHLGDHRVHLQLLMTDISVLVIMWSHATHDDRTRRTTIARWSCVRRAFIWRGVIAEEVVHVQQPLRPLTPPKMCEGRMADVRRTSRRQVESAVRVVHGGARPVVTVP